MKELAHLEEIVQRRFGVDLQNAATIPDLAEGPAARLSFVAEMSARRARGHSDCLTEEELRLATQEVLRDLGPKVSKVTLGLLGLAAGYALFFWMGLPTLERILVPALCLTGLAFAFLYEGRVAMVGATALLTLGFLFAVKDISLALLLALWLSGTLCFSRRVGRATVYAVSVFFFLFLAVGLLIF